MDKKSLHTFYMGLIPGLWSELMFFIPDNLIPEDILDKLDFLKDYEVFNKVCVIDDYKGPIEYKEGRNNNRILLKGAALEKNIFELLERKTNAGQHEFDYILDKYFEQSECLFYITNWMNDNLQQFIECNDTTRGLFQIQFSNYKTHFKALVKNFYPNREGIPEGNFNANKMIETYFPDITKSLKRSNPTGSVNPIVLVQEEQIDRKELKTTRDSKIIKTPPLKDKKASLVTEKEAEKALLKTFFNIELH